MAKKNYNVIGVMSGTSLDGVDLVYVSIIPEHWSFKILKAETISYPEDWQNNLKESVNYEADRLKKMDIAYTDLLGNTIKSFIKKNGIVELDAICSHGHTVLHQPEKGVTYQIGNRPEIASIVDKKVVCDFRVQDVELGGQGAPLVPIGDRLFFGDYDYCLNLGGFANISFEKNNERLAFDICPVNIVMNHYCKIIGYPYDDKGGIASKGKINKELLTELNSLNFYKQKPPKSLGLEWVKDRVFPIIEPYNISVNTILRTFVEHIAIQISETIKAKKDDSILVTGGGAYNDFLIFRLKDLCKNKIVIPSKDIIEYKEALIFGLLGVLKMRSEINCLCSVTGATKDHSSGKIFLP